MHKVMVVYLAVQMAKLCKYSAESLVFLTFYAYMQFNLQFMKQYFLKTAQIWKEYLLLLNLKPTASFLLKYCRSYKPIKKSIKEMMVGIFLIFALDCLCKVWFTSKWINFQEIPKVCREFFSSSIWDHPQFFNWKGYEVIDTKRKCWKWLRCELCLFGLHYLWRM